MFTAPPTGNNGVRPARFLRLPDRESGALVPKEEVNVGISLSLILVAAGAILLWAVNASVAGLNIHTVGVILLVVGIVGFITSLFFLSSWGGFGTHSDTTVVHHDRVVEQ
jgi:hypothetical protein